MKMKLMFLTLILLVVSCAKNSQNNQQEDVKGKWRWQNPDNVAHEVDYEINDSMVYKFDYPNCGSDDVSGLISEGLWEVKGKTLILTFDGVSSSYLIGWKKNGDLTLTATNGQVDVFSIEDGPNDKFYINFDRSQGESPLGTGESSSNSSAPATASPTKPAPDNSGNPF